MNHFIKRLNRLLLVELRSFRFSKATSLCALSSLLSISSITFQPARERMSIFLIISMALLIFNGDGTCDLHGKQQWTVLLPFSNEDAFVVVLRFTFDWCKIRCMFRQETKRINNDINMHLAVTHSLNVTVASAITKSFFNLVAGPHNWNLNDAFLASFSSSLLYVNEMMIKISWLQK